MPNDLLALARQPRRTRRKGSVREVATSPRRCAPEKQVERWCDDLVEKCSGEVVRFSQSRATNQTRGISDRRYRLFGHAFWFEVKAEDGKLSNYQYDFISSEMECDCLAACGTHEDLAAFVAALRRSRADAMELARVLLQRWS